MTEKKLIKKKTKFLKRIFAMSSFVQFFIIQLFSCLTNPFHLRLLSPSDCLYGSQDSDQT